MIYNRGRLSCTFWYRWQGWTNVCISAALTEIILILRLRALYANDRRVTVVVVVCFILTTCASALIMGFALSSGHGFTVDVIEWEGHLYCIGTNIPKFLPAYFGPVFAFEALLGGLAAYKWIRDTSGANRGMVIPALMKTLVRDSCVYFIWMTAMYSVTATIWACVPIMLEVPAGILNASGCVLGNRLILNLRSRHSIHVDRPSPESSTLLSLPDLSTTGSGDTTLVSEPEEMENKIAVPRPTPALSCSARASPSSTTLSPPLRQRSATGPDRTTVGSPV
ncbi:hypothetical protein OF83DRAFT_741591 [Amylostereum chailletii]|nr:hypothetical protein OF83DRAFT_741591 [Amylostereum chailletii]